MVKMCWSYVWRKYFFDERSVLFVLSEWYFWNAYLSIHFVAYDYYPEIAFADGAGAYEDDAADEDVLESDGDTNARADGAEDGSESDDDTVEVRQDFPEAWLWVLDSAGY